MTEQVKAEKTEEAKKLPAERREVDEARLQIAPPCSEHLHAAAGLKAREK